jgi:predicted RND superfamily exporter protein
MLWGEGLNGDKTMSTLVKVLLVVAALFIIWWIFKITITIVIAIVLSAAIWLLSKLW